MTFVGKIFVVLILVMSCIFMALSVMVYATHKNWKDIATNPNTGLRRQVATAQQQADTLQAELDRLNETVAKERAARAQAVAAAETRTQSLRESLLDRERETNDLVSRQRLAIETVESTQNALKRLTTEVETLRREIRVAHDDANTSFDKVVELTDRLYQTQGDLQRHKSSNQGLLERIGRMNRVLDAHDLDEYAPLTDIPPRLDGIVTDVSRDQFVELSLGENEGLQAGHLLDVFRRGKYLGRVRVQKVQPNRAVATILDEFRQAPILRGDRVATKIR